MKIVTEAFNFPVPLVTLSERLHVLELFHGPTLAFKDFGARFMARLMGYFVAESGKQLTVIVATSGDTGSAVAQAFLGVSGIRVVILYPAGRVSDAQEKQLTTLGQNITALEVSGSFDDCQRLAKQALVDPVIAEKLTITSANSINIARLIPQSFYYFAAVAQLGLSESLPVFSVPSGNFGNLTGGLLAKRIGLGVAQFIAATNANDVVPEFLRSGKLIPRASRHTISNAMDVGNPSNFARIVDLYDNDLQAIRRDIWGCSFSDEETLARHARCGAAPRLRARSSHGRRRAGLGELRKTKSTGHAGNRARHGASRQVRRNRRSRHRRPAGDARTPGGVPGPAEEIHSLSQPFFRVAGISAIGQHLILCCEPTECWMKLLIAIAGFFILFATLWEAFETIILPRRVTRPIRLVRMFYRVTWKFWAAINRLIRSKKVRDAHLSYYGPLSLLGLFATWAFLLILGFCDAALGRRLSHQRAGRNADVPDRFLLERNDVFSRWDWAT